MPFLAYGRGVGETAFLLILRMWRRLMEEVYKTELSPLVNIFSVVDFES